ncbi:MAG: hypothetical protein P8R42_16595 [Candidatus Binatia bacterium]|nr:hypothetical protein [Candidatus Binatia bacterium]
MRRLTVTAFALFLLLATFATAADLPTEIVQHLEKDPYVYISSTRKSGDLSAAAEIWFAWDGTDLVVGTNVKSYRVRRIQAGRAAARIWVENSDGPWFGATGAVVNDEKAQDALVAAFAKKYGEKFTESWQAKFRKGFGEGTTVVVRYVPTDATGKGPAGLPPAETKK